MIWILYILIDAVINWFWIEKKKQVPDYVSLTVCRAMTFILYGAVIINVQTYIQGFELLIFCTATFWVLFDILLNWFRGKKLTYLGENSKIDQFGVNHPAIYWPVKILYFLFAIAVKIF